MQRALVCPGALVSLDAVPHSTAAGVRTAAAQFIALRNAKLRRGELTATVTVFGPLPLVMRATAPTRR